MSQETSEEKTLPASAKKLREARKKGQISHSKEMVTAVVTLSAFGYLLVRSSVVFVHLRDGLLAIPELLDLPFDRAVSALAGRLSVDVAFALTPLVGLIVAAAVLANVVVNGGVLAAFDPILPKAERLDPIAGLKRLFSTRSLIELVKAIAKVLVVGGLTLYLVRGAIGVLVDVPACGIDCVPAILGGLLVRLLLTICGFFLVLGGLDIGLQRWLFARDMRMTQSEQKRERKDMMGDPLIRRQLSRERRGSRSKTGLRNATFIIRSADTALALRYAPPDALVPVLVAKGADETARDLLDEARQLAIPIVFDAPTAAALAPRLKIGALIGKDMFQPVIACMHEAKLL